MELGGVLNQYPWLDHDESCEVCIIGGGLTGAMCALRLAERGLDIVLITDAPAGSGVTADVMPCAEYDWGCSLKMLSKRLGDELALAALELGASAVAGLEELASSLGAECSHSRRDCLLFSDDDSDIELLSREFAARRQAGFDCSFVSRSAAHDIFSFNIAGGIISQQLCVEVQPYELTQLCLRRASEHGARIYENTKAVRMEYGSSSTTVQASTFRSISAEQVIIASSAACAEIIDGISQSRTGFIAVSRPVTHFTGWPGRCSVRSWATPRISLATSPDGRVCISGLESAIFDERSRLAGLVHIPSMHEKRFDELDQILRYLFPQIYLPEFDAVHAYRSYRTADGLPIIGRCSEHSGCIFAACCGTDGLLMSEVASELVTGLCCGEEDELSVLFSPDRRTLRR